MLGKRAGLKTLMVGSGVHSLEDIRNWEKDPEKTDWVADYYVDSLGDLLKLVSK